MSEQEINQQLERITQKIVKEFQPERIILFGSYAIGRQKKGSDFDFFIVKNTNLRQFDRSVAVRRILPRDRTIGVDLMVYNPQELRQAISKQNVFIKKILEEGKELYARAK